MMKNNIIINNRQQKILCVFAHREDHVVFGWPVIQNELAQKYLFTCTDDYNDIVLKSCDISNTRFVGSAYLKNGFADPTRNLIDNKLYKSNYGLLSERLKVVVNQVKPDIILTHNPWGEYGHYDHRMCFEVCYNEFNIPIIITDIIAKSSYYHTFNSVPKTFLSFYQLMLAVALPDYLFYSRHAKLFKREKAWTSNNNLNYPKYPNKNRLWWVGNNE